MRLSELDDIEKEVLLGEVVERARADLNDGRPLTETRITEQRCGDCMAVIDPDKSHTCRKQINRNRKAARR